MSQKMKPYMAPAGSGNFDSLKKKYQSPILTTYGSVSHLTRATGSANGDAGQGMMVGNKP